MTTARVGLRRGGLIITSLAVAAVLVATCSPGNAADRPATLHLCLVCGELGGTDVVQNVPLFLPLGLGLALLGARRRTAILLAFTLSFAVETLQLFFIVGRESSLSDLITNTVGGALGWTLSVHWQRWLRPEARVATALVAVAAGAFVVVPVCTGWLLAPSVPAGDLYAQVAHVEPPRPSFPGRVERVLVGGLPLVDGLARDQAMLRRALLRDSMRLLVAVRIDGTARGSAPVLAIAQPDAPTLLDLSQSHGRFVFTPNMQAARVRLRRPRAGIPAGVSSAKGTRTELLAERVPAGLRVGTTGSPANASEYPLGPNLAWAFFVPVELSETRLAAVLTSSTLALLTLPGVFWLCWLKGSSRRRGIGGLAGSIIAGQWMATGLYELAVPGAADIFGLVFGALAGVGLAAAAGAFGQADHPSARSPGPA